MPNFQLPNQRWEIAPAQIEPAQKLAEVTQLSPLLAQVLLNRGIETPEQAQLFLSPELAALPEPIAELPDLAISLELLENAIARHQKIAICGDYDADGMTSTALLLRSLRWLGANVDYAIPSRMKEGYGINRRIVEDFHSEGVALILTVDNGISAYDPIERARQLGVKVIVTDHHDLPQQLPPADAILNPKLIPESSPYRGLAGVGVAYILAVSLAQQMGKAKGLVKPLLELFTLGTIADLAPLTGVNRRWVKRGLQLLPQSQLAGVQALIQVSGVQEAGGQVGRWTLENYQLAISNYQLAISNPKSLKPEDIGFRLGPRINAVGRIADPQIVIDLLTTDDMGLALERAMQCEQINRHRQLLCEEIEQEAIAHIEQSQLNLQQERVLLLVQPNWHHGVIGIVASRLVERYGVPVFIGTYEDEGEEEETLTRGRSDAENLSQQLSPRQSFSHSPRPLPGDRIRGSARGIPEFHVFEALEFCADLLGKFGGHKAAGGFSLPGENLEKLRSRLRTFAHQCLQPEHLKPVVKIDAQASLDQINLDLYRQIDALHPCGIENSDPVFWTPNVRAIDQQIVGKGHIKLTLIQDITAEDLRCRGALEQVGRWGEENYPRSQAEPGNAVAEPGNAVAEPGNAVAEPGNAVAEPGNALAEPGNAITQIKAIAWRWRDYFPLPSRLDIAYKLRENNWNGSKSIELELVGVRLASPQANGTVKAFPPLIFPTIPAKAEFYYNERRYTCGLFANGFERELRIRNSQGKVLAIAPGQTTGLLGMNREESEEIDISQPGYYKLIQAALQALEIAEKNH
ncbi:single-stranded-DNA-specific exonuclease RecJ [Microseira wollei]|uniref:Single-stranded-DNA-specific exonuclease RecJ n=1 Tax=Microseira wollei NIES-4236 TaxID=2530354 RepID=A0AAV3XK10_9CYAN|nr:DHH family phosphoesterase [Microseira wollei]GET40762.1 single-stranded-DNA-specific exonuclease RecJ [Microseira wollei NIES-4236]